VSSISKRPDKTKGLIVGLWDLLPSERAIARNGMVFIQLIGHQYDGGKTSHHGRDRCRSLAALVSFQID
jgi:hypothetical protein